MTYVESRRKGVQNLLKKFAIATGIAAGTVVLSTTIGWGLLLWVLDLGPEYMIPTKAISFLKSERAKGLEQEREAKKRYNELQVDLLQVADRDENGFLSSKEQADLWERLGYRFRDRESYFRDGVPLYRDGVPVQLFDNDGSPSFNFRPGIVTFTDGVSLERFYLESTPMLDTKKPDGTIYSNRDILVKILETALKSYQQE